MVEPKTDEESIDLVLRHISQRFPEDLARAILGEGVSTAVPYETQLDARQRRLDRILDTRVRGERRLLHVEWQAAMRGDTAFRMYEYNVMLALAAAAESLEKAQSAPRIDSIIVLLSGREELWPSHGVYRTSSDEELFSGIHYRIEAVYQRTVRELLARSSPFWLIFAPLAADADADKLVQVVETLRATTTRGSANELGTAMAVLATADGRGRGLADVVRSLLPRELVMRNWIYQEGKEEGLALGLARGREEGRAEAALDLLVRQVERRLSRTLNPDERAGLADRVRVQGAERVLEALIDRSLSPEELAAWAVGTTGQG